MTNNTIDNALQASITALNEERASIQELKEELEKMKANYRSREEIRESLIREEVNYDMVINHKKRSWNSAYDSYHGLKLKLSMDGLPEDIRADLEEKMAVARERFHEVQAEMEKEELEFDERVKYLKDELRALDLIMRQ